MVAFFVFSAALPDARRSGGRHRRRHRHQRGHRAHPPEAWPRPAVPAALRHLGLGGAARRSRHLHLHQPARHAADRRSASSPRCRWRSARSSIAVAVAVPLGVIGAWKVGKADRPLRDAVLGARLLDTGVRAGLSADLPVRHQLDWLPVQGYTPHPRGLLAVAQPPHPAVDRARHHLHRADRPHHARHHARRAGRRTTCAPRTPRAWRQMPC